MTAESSSAERIRDRNGGTRERQRMWSDLPIKTYYRRGRTKSAVSVIESREMRCSLWTITNVPASPIAQQIVV